MNDKACVAPGILLRQFYRKRLTQKGNHEMIMTVGEAVLQRVYRKTGKLKVD